MRFPFRPPWTVDRVAHYLVAISTLYLALPHFLFYTYWLRWPWGVIAFAALGLAVIETWRIVKKALPDEDRAIDDASDANLDANPELAELQVVGETDTRQAWSFTRQDVLVIGTLCLVWLILAGVGGFVSQDLDWNKHNTVLNSLMHKPWPTVYEIYKVDVPLVYYIAYYLPAALVGKVGGWLSMNVALLGWSLLGLVIAVLWFCILVGRVSYRVLLIFIFFSGLDVIGKVLANVGVWNITVRDWRHIDSWATIWQYSSNATLINWVPPQAISGWIVTGMLLYSLIRLRRRELLLLPFGLSALWSPFITVGVMPYLLIDFLVDKEPWSQRLRKMISLPNVVGVGVLAITGFYFSAKASEGSPIVIQDFLSGLSVEAYRGSLLDAIAFLLFFCLLEFGFYVILLYRGGAVRGEQWRWLFDITVVTLCILPWFKLGIYNDLVMRASIPALFLLTVVVTRAIFDQTLARQTRVALVVVLLVGAVTPGIEFKRHIQHMLTLPAPIFDAAAQRWDFVYYMRRQTFFFGQYAGSIDSPFFQLAARQISPENHAQPDSQAFS